MAHVTVSINGRHYRMACEDGQESYLMRLAKEVDQRIDLLRAQFGEIGDMRLTIMAALAIADELVEAGNRERRLEQDLEAAQHAGVASADEAQETQTAIAAALTSAAERIEGVTRSLNQGLADGEHIVVG